jgi:hypothetical protein
MMKDTSYNEWLKKDYGELIDALGVSELQKRFMRSRWLDQVMWMESKCKKTQRWYYILRLTAIVGGIIVPVLINKMDNYNYPATILSVLVAISVAVEEFFHFGERWRHYRQSVELLKIQARQFFQLSGPYQSFTSHVVAYSVFAAKVEEIMQNEVNVYISEIVKEKKEEKKKDC